MAKRGWLSVSVTYVTGMLVKFGRGLGQWACGQSMDKPQALQIMPWAGLLAGAVLGAVCMGAFGERTYYGLLRWPLRPPPMPRCPNQPRPPALVKRTGNCNDTARWLIRDALAHPPRRRLILRDLRNAERCRNLELGAGAMQQPCLHHKYAPVPCRTRDKAIPDSTSMRHSS